MKSPDNAYRYLGNAPVQTVQFPPFYRITDPAAGAAKRFNRKLRICDCCAVVSFIILFSYAASL